MKEAVCKTCGVVYIISDKLPASIECLCKENNFKIIEKTI